MQTCFVSKSFGELSWGRCEVRGTLDISWYRGLVATTIIGSGLSRWLLVKLRVVVFSSCEAGRVSALVVLREVASSSWEAGRDSQHSPC